MAPGGPRVTAVIVTYQSAHTIGRAMEAARKSHQCGLLDCVVVDNGSNDATATLLKRDSNWANVVLTGKNNGFGRGCNVGLQLSKTPYTVFINPDAVVSPDALRTMIDFLDSNPRVGIVGPAILEGEADAEPTLQETGERATPASVLRSALPWRRKRPLSRPIKPGAAGVRTGWVCGAVLMARTDLMQRLGGFDPRFFLYWEEIDVCKRAEGLGFEVWALGAAVAHHVGGASSSPDDTRLSGCVAKHYLQSRYYYMVKHHGWLAAAVAEGGEFVLLSLRSVLGMVRGRGLGWLRSRMETPLFSLPAQG